MVLCLIYLETCLSFIHRLCEDLKGKDLDMFVPDPAATTAKAQNGETSGFLLLVAV